MDVQKLKVAVEQLQKDLDGALVACDIWPPGTAQSIIGYNSQPKAAALFDKLTLFLVDALKESEFPAINEYYMLDLVNNATIIIVQLEEGYQWGMFVDKSKVHLGLLLSVAIPRAKKMFSEALHEL